MTTENSQPADEAAAAAAAEAAAAAAKADPPVKSAAEIAADEASKAAPLADPGLAKIGETYLKDGKPDYEKIAADLARAHQDLPGEGQDYELAFPETFDLKGADGEVIKLDPADPIAGAFKEVAKEFGIGQKAVSALLGIYGDVVKTAHGQNTEAAKAVQDAEFAKLDPERPKAEARVQAVARSLTAAFGKDAKLANPLIDSLTTAAQVEAFEKLLEKMNGAPAAAPKPNGKATDKSFAARLYG
ncbi:MAG: hypothetical protein B7Z36_05980 [Novosphingobium sp. 12-63-9]|nr:MAG: hypothetical protein B7Z36_05980 [Novosphingobium sp. 12-63-9]